MIVNVLNEILINYTMIQEIWQHHRETMISRILSETRNWEKWERRTIAIDTCTLLFSESEEKSSGRQTSLVSLTNHAASIGTCTLKA